jgi:hypothetical protein
VLDVRSKCPVVDVSHRQVTYKRIKLLQVRRRKPNGCLVVELDEKPRCGFPSGAHLPDPVDLCLPQFLQPMS